MKQIRLLMSSLSRKRNSNHLSRIKTFLFAFTCLAIAGCSSALNVFGDESVTGNESVVTIPFEYEEVPLVKVKINSKTYTFLVDTGAPTVISSSVFEDLQLKKGKERAIKDSQGVSKQQQFVVLPEMKLGSLTYRNIGAVVNDLRDVFELDCKGIDGILGANQMALSVWKFDYQNKEIHIAPSLTSFSIKGYKTMGFYPKKHQMTPLLEVNLNGNKSFFTYDTGFSGSLHIKDTTALNSYPNVSFTGISSTGIYGAGTSEKRQLYKIDSLHLGDVVLKNVFIKQESSSVIGNELIDNYSSIIDWKTKKIYWKEVASKDSVGFETFGLGYRMNELKAIVAYRVNEVDIPINLGDTLLSINDTSFENLDLSTACFLTNNKIEKDLRSIKVRYLKNGQEMELTIQKQKLLVE